LSGALFFLIIVPQRRLWNSYCLFACTGGALGRRPPGVKKGKAMTDYVAPLQDMLFTINELAGAEEIARLPGYEEFTPDLSEAVLEEAGKFCAGVLSPLNRVGDQQGSRIENGEVRATGCRVQTPNG